MEMLRRGTALTVVLMALVSCSGLFKKNDSDAGAPATTTEPVVTTPVSSPPVLALNQGDVARYPDETPLATPPKLAFQRSFNIRESVPSGKVITGLGKGALATQIAKRPPYVLITFESPTAPGATMMGWVHQDAFTLVVADAGTLTCAAGETPLFSDVPTCGKVCATNADCPANFGCTGSSNRLAAGNKPGEPVKVCAQTVVHDAGPPTPPPVVDAGPPPVVDAGKPATVDAGKNNAEPPAGTDEVNALPGKTCPGSFIYVDKTGHCHRSCKESDAKTKCQSNGHFCSRCDTSKMVCTHSRGVCQ